MRRVGSLIWALVALLGLGALARRHVDVVEVRGRSMAPTLLPGDRLLVVERSRPRVGDVVLAADPRAPDREVVKRVASIDSRGVVLRGDNPAFSTDARAFGRIPADAIAWRAAFRYWPPGRIGPLAAAPPTLALVDEGGEPACAFPDALIAGD